MDCNNCIGLFQTDSKPVDSSSTFEFTFTNLQAHTAYCVQSVGTYMEVPGIGTPEETPGDYIIHMTTG